MNILHRSKAHDSDELFSSRSLITAVDHQKELIITCHAESELLQTEPMIMFSDFRSMYRTASEMEIAAMLKETNLLTAFQNAVWLS